MAGNFGRLLKICHLTEFTLAVEPVLASSGRTIYEDIFREGMCVVSFSAQATLGMPYRQLLVLLVDEWSNAAAYI